MKSYIGQRGNPNCTAWVSCTSAKCLSQTSLLAHKPLDGLFYASVDFQNCWFDCQLEPNFCKTSRFCIFLMCFGSLCFGWNWPTKTPQFFGYFSLDVIGNDYEFLHSASYLSLQSLLVQKCEQQILLLLFIPCVLFVSLLNNVGFSIFVCFVLKGVRKGSFGVKPPLSLIFYKILLPAQRRLIVFAYFLLVNLPT